MTGPKQVDFWARIYFEDTNETLIGPSWGTAQGAYGWAGEEKREPCQIEVYRREIRDSGYKDILLNAGEEDDGGTPSRERVDELTGMLRDTFSLEQHKAHRHTDAGFGPNRDGWLSCPTCVRANVRGVNGPKKEAQAQAVLDGE